MMLKGIKFFFMFVITVSLIFYLVDISYNFSDFDDKTKTFVSVQDTKQVTLNTFLENYRSGGFEKVELVDNKTINGYVKVSEQEPVTTMGTDTGYKKISYVVISTQKPVDTSLHELGLTFTGSIPLNVITNEQNFFSKIFLEQLLPLILFIVILVFGLKFFGPKGAGMPFGVSVGKLSNGKNTVATTKFKDVAGMEESKQELQEIVDFLKNPDKYLSIGARIPKGVLLYGVPGCGKTLLARAVAGEANVPFFSASGSEFMEMLVGMGAAKVRELFNKAKASSPAIIFIDELDTIGKKRGAGYTGGHQEQEQTLNQILTEMDGFEQDTKIIVIAATNRPDVLDSALLRPGRFDRKVFVSKPTVEERLEIIKLHSAKRKMVDGIDLEGFAKRTSGFVGADLESMINEASLKVAREHRQLVTNKDLEYALEKVVMGPEKKIKTLKERERKIVAYHELGHAVTAFYLPNVDPVEKISVVSRGMALGVTRIMPQEDSYLSSKAKFLEDIVSLLGGRACEEIFFGKENITTGASNDFEKVTRIVTDMVIKYGMTEEIGTINYTESDTGYVAYKPFSEKTAEKIDHKIKEIIDDAYTKSLKLIKDNKDLIDKMAHLLIDKEYLTKEEFENIMNHQDQIDKILFEIKEKHDALLHSEKLAIEEGKKKAEKNIGKHLEPFLPKGKKGKK